MDIQNIGKNRFVLEGANHNDTHSLHYHVDHSSVPENASVLRIGKARLTLHSRIDSFMQPQYLVECYRDRADVRGWEMHEEGESKMLSWVYEMPRTVILEDGRMFLNEMHYRPGFTYYLPHIHRVINDAALFFTGQLSKDNLCALHRRMF